MDPNSSTATTLTTATAAMATTDGTRTTVSRTATASTLGCKSTQGRPLNVNHDAARFIGKTGGGGGESCALLGSGGEAVFGYDVPIL